MSLKVKVRVSLKVRFTDSVIVYFYDILIDQSILWLNKVTLNKVNIPKQYLVSVQTLYYCLHIAYIK